uniref:Uncharacterized protein n=1 Tax=Anopheles melas TaxID=34690 RepID=A0A182TGR0_9DIPT
MHGPGVSVLWFEKPSCSSSKASAAGELTGEGREHAGGLGFYGRNWVGKRAKSNMHTYPVSASDAAGDHQRAGTRIGSQRKPRSTRRVNVRLCGGSNKILLQAGPSLLQHG